MRLRYKAFSACTATLLPVELAWLINITISFPRDFHTFTWFDIQHLVLVVCKQEVQQEVRMPFITIGLGTMFVPLFVNQFKVTQVCPTITCM